MKKNIIFIVLFAANLNASEISIKPVFKKGDCFVVKEQITNTEFTEYNEQENKYLNKRKVLKIGKHSYLYESDIVGLGIMEFSDQDSYEKIKCK